MLKKPLLYLPIILLILVGGGISLILALTNLYSWVFQVPVSSVPKLNGLLIGIPALFFWIPVSLILSNAVLFSVPRFRRIADDWSAAAERPGFRESQRQLIRLSMGLAIICLPLIALGFVV